jgi:hypothetical protein
VKHHQLLPLPSYMFFLSGSAFLLLFQLDTLREDCWESDLQIMHCSRPSPSQAAFESNTADGASRYVLHSLPFVFNLSSIAVRRALGIDSAALQKSIIIIQPIRHNKTGLRWLPFVFLDLVSATWAYSFYNFPHIYVTFFFFSPFSL